MKLANIKRPLKNKKGFTLIEIIVVLIIIAILVAVSIPTMLGFVNEARGRAFAADARVGMIAAQSVVTELRAAHPAVAVATSGNYGAAPGTALNAHPVFVRMVGSSAEAARFTHFQVNDTDYRVEGLIYTVAGEWSIRIIDGRTDIRRITGTVVAYTNFTEAV